jgi:pentatricopeptide repeat protein
MKAVVPFLLAAVAFAQSSVPRPAPVPPAKPAQAPTAKSCELLAASGKVDQAQSCYRLAITANPASAALHIGLADLLSRKGEPDKAEAEFRTAIRLAPTNVDYAVNFLNFLVRQKSIDHLAELVPIYEQKWPGVADIASAHGWLFVQKGEIEPARLEYRKAANLAPASSAGYYTQFVGSLIETGKNEDAIDLMRERMAIIPASSTQHSQLAHLLEAQKRWAEAEIEYRAVDGPAGLNGFGSQTLSFAMRMERNGQTDAAISAYTALAKASGQSFVAPFHLLSLLEQQERWDQLATFCAGLNGNVSCQVLIKQLCDKGKVDGAFKLYKAMIAAEQPFGFNQFSGTGMYRAELLKALGTAGRWDDALGLCANSTDVGCQELLKGLFAAGRRDDAIGFARKLAGNMPGAIQDFQLSSLADQISGLDLDGQIAMKAEATRMANNPYHLAEFLKSMNSKGKLQEAAEALRRVAPSLELSANAILLYQDLFWKLAYEGYLTPVATQVFQLADRGCRSIGPMVMPGQEVSLAYHEMASCFGLGQILVEYNGNTWAAGYSNFKLVVSPASRQVRSLSSLTLQQVTATVPLNGAAPVQSSQTEIVDEITLGINARNSIVSSHAVYEDDPAASEAGTHAFQMLMNTSIAKSGNVASFRLTLLNDNSVNAFSTAGGQIYVNKGMLPVIGQSEGMWAAVIGHEAGHVVEHHQYKQYVRQMSLKITQEALRQQAATGNKAAQWAWLFSLSGGRMLNMKLSRNDELEADRMGMMMMAEAGFHPDYIMTLMQRLQTSGSEKSKVSTFLSSDHPRWETREKKVRAAYAEALKVFEARWPDAASSPGGVPPKR